MLSDVLVCANAVKDLPPHSRGSQHQSLLHNVILVMVIEVFILFFSELTHVMAFLFI